MAVQEPGRISSHRSSIISQLFAALFLLGAASFAQAATESCTVTYGGVVDGNFLSEPPPSLVIDGPCIIKNWPASHPYSGTPTPTINFNIPDGNFYLLIFDNAIFGGNMSCANLTNQDGSPKLGIWYVNGGAFEGGNNCQDFVIPVEKIDKQRPGPTATVGVPFTYTLTIPVMYLPTSTGGTTTNTGSAVDLGLIHVTDNITAAATAVAPALTGAEMSLVSLSARVKGTNAPVTLSNASAPGAKNIAFDLPDVPAGQQILVDVTVVLDAVPGNVPGTVFTNTAQWKFARWVDINKNGVNDPGEFFDPLPGENGVSLPMTITGPNLVVNKTTSASAVSVSNTIPYSIDVQNTGGWEAWNVTLQDILPSNTSPASAPAKGMCEADPVTFGAGLSARLLKADGSLDKNLVAVTDYTVSWGGAVGPNACKLSLTLTDAAGAIAGNGGRLIVSYETRLDTDFTLGGSGTLTNVAGATQWFNGVSTVGGRMGFTRALSNGTPGTADHEDNATVTVAVSGYYFEKTVTNLATGVSPATAAAPGDALRYRLHLFNVNQNITDITVTDPLSAGNFVLPPTIVSCVVVGPVTVPDTLTTTMTPACSFSAGAVRVTGAGGKALLLPQGDDLLIEFDVTLQAGLNNGDTVSNQATLVATGITSQAGPYLSDDPNDSFGVADPAVPGDEFPTDITIVAPGPLLKANPATTNVAIGQQFSYQITVPATPVAMTLYDVHILDTLPANLRFVSATSQVGASTRTLLDTDNGANNNLDLMEPAIGLDIPAGQSAVVTITVVLANRLVNQSGTAFSNAATYHYQRINGATTTPIAGAGNTTAPMTVIEPVLSIGKVVSNITSPGNPAQGGDVLQYTVTLPNSGNATAFDVTVRDTLPPELTLVAGSASATINGVPVAGFNPAPANVAGGVLVWGNSNNDSSLDIPPVAGQPLVLSYQVSVVQATNANLVNSVIAIWTSQNGSNANERNGSNCPAGLNDYCAGPATATIPSQDTTAFTKANVGDSWSTAPSTGSDSILRVGDTATYALTLSLREGQTRGVVVTDALPAGMALASNPTIIKAANITYTLTAPPVAGATGTLTWNFGTISNVPDSVTTNDTVVIQYVARVVANSVNTIAQTASTTLTNNAQLAYTGAAAVLTGTDSIEVRQPVLVTLSKSDRLGRVGPSSAAPLNVNVATDVMQFRLQACNASGSTAPAYSLRLVDTLASELDEASITVPAVTVNGAAQTAGIDYSYTAPAVRGGSMTFVLNTPLATGQCAVVDYNIGFHTDVAPNQLWNNSVTSSEYWSLPAASGQQYPAVGPAQFWMTNNTGTDPLPLKSLVSPASETTIGQAVVYQITVPAINAARNNVVITDTLPSALVYDSASVAGALTLTDNSVAPGQVSLSIAQIPAGQPAVITLNAHVANTATSNAGNSFSNQASYTYNGYAGPALVSAVTPMLTIVEPLVTVAKAVTPTTPPVAGNILHYTVDLASSSGATLSSAYDLGLVDTLSLGLAYVAGTATVGGVAVAPTVSGDGVITPQTLTWTGIDIPEGTALAVEYDVRVLNGVSPSQVLSNSVTARWTSLDGVNANERNGTASPAHNDYFASASTSLGAPDNTTFAKSRLSDTFNAADANLRIGDRVDYELRLGLQEGTHNNLVLGDLLPTGMVFESVVSADFFGTPGVANPVVSGQTLTWNLGAVTNSADGNPANDFLVIVYRARVLNNDTLAQTPTTQTLANNASLNYTVGGVPVLPKTASQSVTVLQPTLVVSKSVAPAGGDSVIAAGEVISYSVDITNNGTAPAYDTVLTDTLPAGLRQGGVTTTSISLVTAGTVLPVLAPAYSVATGVASWNFDNGTANTYTIPVGDTLRVVYTVLADAGLGASLTLSNAATATLYHSFDDEAVPAGGVAGEREVYGPSNTATATVTTPGPGALQKATTQATAAIGEQFSYRITVPAVPVSTALHDVRITDDLDASAADLRFVSVSKISGSAPWTPANTGSATQLVIEDTTNGIDIPAGEQVTVEVTVELLNTAGNTSGLVFSNSADYSYNRVANTPATQAAGLPGSSGTMTIIGADSLTLEKSGPATMRYGQPATFTLDVQNTSAARAWDLTITDLLPNPTPGGMCATTPAILSARVFAADGVTPVSAPLVAGTDFSTAFVAGTPACTLTFTGLSAAAALDPSQRLIVTYQAELDADTAPNVQLSNIAGVTQWFSQNTAGAGATGETRTFSRTLSNGTVGTLDHEDAHTITTEPPTMVVQKTVSIANDLGVAGVANPGDTLRYTLTVSNVSPVALPDFALRDDVGALNPGVVFVPGSLTLVSVPAGADTAATNPSGGSNGAGLVDVRNLALGPQGSATETVTVSFDVVLAAVINNGTVVLNQGDLNAFGSTLQRTDDPAIAGNENPTPIVIGSAPLLHVEKTSADLTGNTSVLMPGDTLRYTIRVKNVGNENVANGSLRDLIPSFTSYVANSTRLNGAVVADPAAGISALQNGMAINAPGNPAGSLNANPGDSAPFDMTTADVATISFDVVVNSGTLGGTIISNQGYVNGTGAGGATFSEQPSDDPGVSGQDNPAVIGDEDPTRDIIGGLPLLNAQKRVAIAVDNNSNGVADPGDALRYTLTVSNAAAVAATGVVLTDTVPANTTYVAGSTTLNGAAVADAAGAVLPLVDGEAINSPSAASGTIAAGASAVVVFEVTINAAVPAGTVISNQGQVDSSELPADLTDADGVDSNGDQPTTIVVGGAQQLSILKEVFVVGGGAALPGGQLEYVVRVSNTGTTPATQVMLSDDLSALGADASFIAGSATLNGSASGVSYVAPVLSANYAGTYGDLPAGATATLRFRVQISNPVASGTVISNTAQLSWDVPAQTASSTATIPVGAVPGSATLSGRVWHDANLDNAFDAASERNLAGWVVVVSRAGTPLGSTSTDANGLYSFSGLAPTVAAEQYELSFTAPGANASNTAKLGLAASAFSNDLQQIAAITAASGSNVQNLNLPIDPNGVVYNSVTRTPVAGATLTLVDAGSGTLVDGSCFADPVQQGQVTLASGFYKFDLVASATCPVAGSGDYLIQVTPPASAYETGLSRIIPPTTSAATGAYDVPTCAGDANASAECEVQTFADQPSLSVPARTAGTVYYLQLTLNNTVVPADSQIFNNHIALDPLLNDAVSISKRSALVNVSRGQLVPYVITVSNVLGAPLSDMSIVDTFPVGFKYVAGSSRIDGQPVEPVKTNRQLSWSGLQLNSGTQRTIKMLFIVGAGVGEGEYVNRAQVFNSITTGAASGEASATVRVVPDPTFDCTDVIGKVYDDANLNGYQDKGEQGLPGVRVATARGLLITSDDHGRFHITCALTPDETRGSNFILKVDDRSLPSGYRITTENPRVLRATPGKMMKFNFGAAIHKVVRLDLANGIFAPGTTDMRLQWTSRMPLLLKELKKSASILRVAYMAETEDAALVEQRIKVVKQEVARLWAEQGHPYELTIETEVFWRTGAPPARSNSK